LVSYIDGKRKTLANLNLFQNPLKFSRSDILPKQSDIYKRLDTWENFADRYKNDPSDFTIPCEVLENPSFDENDDDHDNDNSELMADELAEEVLGQQIQIKHPEIDCATLVESLRPKILELVKLLPKEVPKYDRPTPRPSFAKSQFSRGVRRFSFSSNFERQNTAEAERDGVKVRTTNQTKMNKKITLNHRSPVYNEAVYTNSDDSMCSMEQDNYLRKNMGKRQSASHRSQKIICKKTVIKKYLVVSSQNSHSYRHGVPYYSAPSTAASSRRQTQKIWKNRIISGSETETSSGGCSRKRWKRLRTSEPERKCPELAIECRQASPEADQEANVRNLSIILKRTTPTEDTNLETLFNIGKEKTTTSKATSHTNLVPKKKADSAASKKVVPPPTRTLTNAAEPLTNVNYGLTTDLNIDDDSAKKVTRPLTLKKAAASEFDIISLSSDTDGDERNLAKMSFDVYAWKRNKKHRMARDTDSDDLDMMSDFQSIVVSVIYNFKLN
jgi:hypothetical protein